MLYWEKWDMDRKNYKIKKSIYSTSGTQKYRKGDGNNRHHHEELFHKNMNSVFSDKLDL